MSKLRTESSVSLTQALRSSWYLTKTINVNACVIFNLDLQTFCRAGSNLENIAIFEIEHIKIALARRKFIILRSYQHHLVNSWRAWPVRISIRTQYARV